MARTKGKPCRERHPGVSHSKRAGYGLVATYRDAVSGKRRSKSLVKLGITSIDAACRWSVDLSTNLQERAAELAKSAGRAAYVPISLEDAISRCTANLRAERTRERTLDTYGRDSGRFAAWCAARQVRNVLAVNVRHLADFRLHVAVMKRTRAAAGGRRGDRASESRVLSPVTVNRILTSVRAFLNWSRKARYLALSRDEIGEALEHVKVADSALEVLRPPEIVAFLEAALAHDAKTWRMTRAEKSGRGTVGATPRNAPVAGCLLLVLLCGCRRGEALNLRWEDVSLDALDGFGNPSPFLTLQGRATKTRRVRRIRLDVCPSIADLLRRLRQESGERGYVFGTTTAPMSVDVLKVALNALAAQEGVPRAGPQKLRQTGESYAAAAPGLGMTTYTLAARYGHSVRTAERYYLEPVAGVPAGARTLEAVLGIEDVARRIAGESRVAAVLSADRTVASE